jgi:hypothetical protein
MKDSQFNLIANIVLIVIILLVCLFAYLHNRGCTTTERSGSVIEKKATLKTYVRIGGLLK